MAENNWIIYQPVQAPVLDATQQAETVTESRWHQPLSEPVRRRALATAVVVASGLFATPFTQPAETVTADKWFAALSEPARAKPVLRTGAQMALSFVEAAPFPEKVSLDRWLQPLNLPVRHKPRVVIGGQPYLAFAPLPVVPSIDRWGPRLSEPPPPRGGLRTSAQPTGAFLSPELITLDKWYRPLAEPTRRRPTLLAGRQMAVAFDPLPFTPSLDWFRALDLPVRPHNAPALATTQQPTGTFLGRGVNLIFTKADGEWSNVTPYARFDDAWVAPIRVAVRFEGTWRTVYSA